MRGAFFPLRRRSAGPPPLLWPYPYQLFPRIVRPLCRFQRYSCPARPNPARRRHPARASAFPAQPYPCAPPASTAQSYPCLPPVFSCAPPPAFPVWPIPAPARVSCAAYPCARPRLLCGLSLHAAGSARRQFLPALRGKGGYWQGASACRARRVALRARPRPPRGLTLRAAGSARLQFLPALRGKGGYWQGASACPVRRPPRRPARASASTAQSYPCLPPVLCAASPCARRLLPVSRGKGGYWN